MTAQACDVTIRFWGFEGIGCGPWGTTTLAIMVLAGISAMVWRAWHPPGERVTITIEPDEPDDWIAKARRFARPKVIAESWTDADIDRIIDEEREAVQPHL